MTVALSEGKFSFYSTDGKVITNIEVFDTVAPKLFGKVIILPLEFCQMLAAAAKEYPNQRLRFSIQSGYVVAEFDEDCILFSRLVRGIDPLDFERIISEQLRSEEHTSELQSH